MSSPVLYQIREQLAEIRNKIIALADDFILMDLRRLDELLEKGDTPDVPEASSLFRKLKDLVDAGSVFPKNIDMLVT